MRRPDKQPQHRVREPPDTDLLQRRLDDGYQRIEQARMLGQDTQAWEEFWIDLLHQYEQAMDELGVPNAE